MRKEKTRANSAQMGHRAYDCPVIEHPLSEQGQEGPLVAMGGRIEECIRGCLGNSWK